MMKTQVTLVFILSLALLMPACGGRNAASAPATDAAASAEAPRSAIVLTPEQLGELGAQVTKNSDRADELLAQHGLSREAFEKAVRDVTENVDASKRYAAAYRRTAA